MSYCSENKIPADVSLGRVIEVIELLGYIKVRNPLKTKAQVAFYVWNGDKKSISFAGIELSINFCTIKPLLNHYVFCEPCFSN